MTVMPKLPTPTARPRAADMDTFDARELIRDGVQSCIVLDGQAYYLRITTAGKLILTK